MFQKVRPNARYKGNLGDKRALWAINKPRKEKEDIDLENRKCVGGVDLSSNGFNFTFYPLISDLNLRAEISRFILSGFGAFFSHHYQ